MAAYLYFAARLDESMASRKWDLPSRLYPAPLLLEPQRPYPPGPLEKTLEAMGYLNTRPVRKPGEYRRAGSGHYYLRARDGWPGLSEVPDKTLDIRTRAGKISDLRIFKGAKLRKAVIPSVPFAEIRAPDQESRKLVTLEQVPKQLLDAVVSTEDRRFYEHFGIDPRGLTRAILVNLLRSARAQGGSTLTQQLAKNYFLTHEKTFSRKLKELFYALALERKFSKDQILELYLNEIYLGQRGGVAVCGVGQAAYAFFSKEVQQLSLEESALLAGLIQAPNAYAPTRHPERAKKRRNLVLDNMLRQGLITEAEHDAAAESPIKLHPGQYVGRTAPYFVDYVNEQLSNSISTATFQSEGYALETTLDLRIQEIAEEALTTHLQVLDKKTKSPLEGAVVVLEPSTGRILAMVGGREYGKSQFNRITLAQRQPGSVIKPLVVLAALRARSSELGPTTLIEDEPLTVNVDGKNWSPRNYDKKFRGKVSLREALEKSLNVPIVRLARDIGFDRISTLLSDMEIRKAGKTHPSIVLGALELSPLQVASAFTAIATNGVVHTPYGLERVLDREGEALFKKRPQSYRVASAADAYLVRDMMRGVLDRGTGKSARSLGYSFEASAKTGTTNEYKDAWFVGFDSSLLVVVWVGSDNPARTGFTGATGALPIWVDIMKNIRQSTRPAPDPLPRGLVERQVCALTREIPSKHCPETIREVFWVGKEPNILCREHSGAFEAVGKTLKERMLDFLRWTRGEQD